MRISMREIPVTLEEVRDMMKKEQAKRCSLIVAAVGVVAILVGLIVWISKKREKDLEEHYEYFDDDFDALDEDFEGFDESIYEDDDEEEEQIEYVKINDFINDEDAATSEGEEASETEETTEE